MLNTVNIKVIQTCWGRGQTAAMKICIDSDEK